MFFIIHVIDCRVVAIQVQLGSVQIERAIGIATGQGIGRAQLEGAAIDHGTAAIVAIIIRTTQSENVVANLGQTALAGHIAQNNHLTIQDTNGGVVGERDRILENNVRRRVAAVQVGGIKCAVAVTRTVAAIQRDGIGNHTHVPFHQRGAVGHFNRHAGTTPLGDIIGVVGHVVGHVTQFTLGNINGTGLHHGQIRLPVGGIKQTGPDLGPLETRGTDRTVAIKSTGFITHKRIRRKGRVQSGIIAAVIQVQRPAGHGVGAVDVVGVQRGVADNRIARIGGRPGKGQLVVRPIAAGHHYRPRAADGAANRNIVIGKIKGGRSGQNQILPNGLDGAHGVVFNHAGGVNLIAAQGESAGVNVKQYAAKGIGIGGQIVVGRGAGGTGEDQAVPGRGCARRPVTRRAPVGVGAKTGPCVGSLPMGSQYPGTQGDRRQLQRTECSFHFLLVWDFAGSPRQTEPQPALAKIE